MEIMDVIKKEKIIAVLRGGSIKNISKICDALEKGGIRIFEITSETPNAMDVIKTAANQKGKNAAVGVGTVLDAETARNAILSGAQFIVSPILNVDIIKMCNRYGVASIIGALTPTEILMAYENGASAVKVFPANAFGPPYLKSISGPLAQIPLIPTGGIDLENIEEYYESSKVAVGLGSSLFNPKRLINESYYKKLSLTANKFHQLLHND